MRLSLTAGRHGSNDAFPTFPALIETTDAQWARFEPLLPDRTTRRGGRWLDHRQVVVTIAFKYRTGKRGWTCPSISVKSRAPVNRASCCYGGRQSATAPPGSSSRALRPVMRLPTGSRRASKAWPSGWGSAQ
ncbi:transposase [Streptomyces naganishii]